MIPGPSRLILLNAGKYDFAEIDLATTIHLVGPNNVGKTTLVNALQFLYVDSTRHMEFGGRSQDETNRYYFHDPFSYILFECLTARGGFHMVGLRGLGPAHRFGFERFAFQGRFRREDFVGEDGLPLPPDQMRAGLAERGFTVLEPRNLVAALTGAADDKGVALGLLPLKGQGDYRRFRRIFGNLLRLSHLRQDDLKQLLLEVNEDAFSALEIDLGGRLAEDFVKASRQKAQLDEMARLEPQATRLVAALDEAAETRSRLVALWRRLRAGQAAEEKTAHREAARLREEGRLRQAEAVDLEARQRAQGEALTEMTGRLAIQENELAALDALERECGTLVAALQEALVHETEDRWSQLREALRGAERTGPDEIAAAATRVERRLDHTRRLLAAAGDNAAGWLRRRFGEDELARLFAVLDPALAGRALGEDVAILDADGLERRLRGLLACFEGDDYRDGAVRLRLAPADLSGLLDPAALAAGLAADERDLAELTRRLAVARDLAGQRRALEALRGVLETERRRLADLRRLEEGRGRRKGWEKALTDLRRERELGRARRDELAAGQRAAADEASRLIGRAEAREAESRALLAELRALTPPIGPLSTEDVVEDSAPAGADLRAALSEYRGQSSRLAALAERIADGRDALAAAGGPFRRPPEDDSALAALLRDELDGLPQRRIAVENAWSGLVIKTANGLRGLLDDLDKLDLFVADLNRLLARASVSDLKQLRLEVRRHPQLVPRLRTVVEHQARGGFDLFADPQAFKRAAQDLGGFLEEFRTLRLFDLFELGFRVTRSDGSEQVHPHLDKIESNGTSITIKVLTNLMLLKSLFRAGKPWSLPFFVDEANALDRDNLRAVVDLAREQGFTAILASPQPAGVAEITYFPQSRGPRVSIHPEIDAVRLLPAEPP